jgi:nitrate reductase alpha subunit
MALMFTGSIGKNGGGMNHYVGQEKLAPVDSWGNITFAKDWNSTARLQQAPIWHYLNTDQYRYDGHHSKYNAVPDNDMTKGHMADDIYKSVRMGHMSYYPQFNKNPLDLAKESGANSDEEIKEYVLNSLKDRSLEYAVGDVDAEDSLKLDILSWMFDNRHKVNNPKYRDDEFHSQVDGFLRLIGAK